MTQTNSPPATPPLRGEVWNVRFDPSVGAEIQKVRPAVVISEDAIGKLPLKIIVPITDWKQAFQNIPWFVHINADSTNGLTKESGADAFQCKSVSTKRFVRRLGRLSANEMEDVASAIGICVGVQ